MSLVKSDNNSDFEDTEEQDEEEREISKKNEKRGIIYLSTIPKFVNVTKIREIFGHYGEVDRVFLQPEEQKGTNKKKKKKLPAKHFTEGWIEFKKKRIAKQVAAMLNNKQIPDRKRSKFYDCIWNIKYLPRFKWAHLSERLAYERAVHKQRMNAEISQAKREANFFAHNVDVSERLAKHQTKKEATKAVASSSQEVLLRHFKQRQTDSEIRENKLRMLNSVSGKVKKKKAAVMNPKGPLDDESREVLLKSLFNSKSQT